MEVNNIARCAFMAVTDPKLITIDLEDLARRSAERTKEMAKLNPPVQNEPAQQELNRLRGQLFSLQERVKNTEIYANNKAGEVELLEQRLTEALKKKNDARQAGNLLAERRGEHNIQLLEAELADAKKEHNFAKQRSAQATRALRTSDGAARIAELKEQLEPTKPLPTK
jgi:SMC interacting uncharacterized protein involved in chromosome segregation